jgi:hypothetical protein
MGWIEYSREDITPPPPPPPIIEEQPPCIRPTAVLDGLDPSAQGVEQRQPGLAGHPHYNIYSALGDVTNPDTGRPYTRQEIDRLVAEGRVVVIDPEYRRGAYTGERVLYGVRWRDLDPSHLSNGTEIFVFPTQQEAQKFANDYKSEPGKMRENIDHQFPGNQVAYYQPGTGIGTANTAAGVLPPVDSTVAGNAPGIDIPMVPDSSVNF